MDYFRYRIGKAASSRSSGFIKQDMRWTVLSDM